MEGIKRLNKEYSNKPGVQRESGSVDTMVAACVSELMNMAPFLLRERRW
jgi:hypothetical protein